MALTAAGYLGLKLATLHCNVSAVWPATGVAIWTVIKFGPRIWPLITLVVVGVEFYLAKLPLLAAVLAAGGSTLEALAGAWIWNLVLMKALAVTLRFTPAFRSPSRISPPRRAHRRARHSPK